MRILNTNKCFVILTILLLLDCVLAAYIGWWRDPFWNAVAHRDVYTFIRYIAYFSIVALTDCFITGYSSYISNIISLNIRTKLTKKAFKLENHYEIEGGAQRIQEDCFKYPALLIQLISGLLRSILMIVVFSVIVITQVGSFYLIVPILYSIIGTGLAGKIAYPLIKLNYINQACEAKFRHVLQERVRFSENRKKPYIEVHRNNFNLFLYTKYLNYFQSFYNQVTVVIPYIALSFLYFTGKIVFGVLMQAASAMTEIINNMSYIINSFSDINKFLSCRKRLREIGII